MDVSREGTPSLVTPCDFPKNIKMVKVRAWKCGLVVFAKLKPKMAQR